MWSRMGDTDRLQEQNQKIPDQRSFPIYANWTLRRCRVPWLIGSRLERERLTRLWLVVEYVTARRSLGAFKARAGQLENRFGEAKLVVVRVSEGPKAPFTSHLP